jgi:GDPmannose 4,6-dehydratase
MDLVFKGSGLEEQGIVTACRSKECKVPPGTVAVRVDPRYFRPSEVEILMGDASKAQRQLKWTPKYDLNALIREMVASDLELFRKDRYLKEGGHKTLNYNE